METRIVRFRIGDTYVGLKLYIDGDRIIISKTSFIIFAMLLHNNSGRIDDGEVFACRENECEQTHRIYIVEP